MFQSHTQQFKQHLSDFMKNHLCYMTLAFVVTDSYLFVTQFSFFFWSVFLFFRLKILLALKSLVYNFGGKQTKRTGTKTGPRSQTIWMRFGSCLSNLSKRVQSPSVVPTVQILISISCCSITGCFSICLERTFSFQVLVSAKCDCKNIRIFISIFAQCIFTVPYHVSVCQILDSPRKAEEKTFPQGTKSPRKKQLRSQECFHGTTETMLLTRSSMAVSKAFTCSDPCYSRRTGLPRAADPSRCFGAMTVRTVESVVCFERN